MWAGLVFSYMGRNGAQVHGKLIVLEHQYVSMEAFGTLWTWWKFSIQQNPRNFRRQYRWVPLIIYLNKRRDLQGKGLRFQGDYIEKENLMWIFI